MSQPPTIGRIVHYRLTQGDVDLINERHPQVVDGRQVRNAVHEGTVLGARVVAAFGGTAVNLKVDLDGYGEYWATSRPEGENPGNWFWPPRV